MKLTIQKPDIFGALASSLCVVHCLATPILFIAHSCATTGCSTTPVWWRSLDYLFLTISFFAIYKSTQTTSKTIMKYVLWSNWFVLLCLITNETQNWISLSETYMHVVAISLSFFHLYNLKYCQCKNDSCCKNNNTI
ncbi:MerC domain-containing protein [Flavobacteriaceae bacterium]|nr:MerC domain-containing protein [Flavobacteriaceae bacterium]